MLRDYRNELEKELQATIAGVLFYFEGHKIGRLAFIDVMGKLREAKVRLENKRLGCKSGLHINLCLCAEGINRSVDNIKYHQRLAERKKKYA